MLALTPSVCVTKLREICRLSITLKVNKIQELLYMRFMQLGLELQLGEKGRCKSVAHAGILKWRVKRTCFEPLFPFVLM